MWKIEMKKSILSLICCFGLIHTAEIYAAGCVVGGSDFETSSELFNPKLSNDGKGWFSKDVDKLLKNECGASCDYSSDVDEASHVGMASGNFSTSATLTAKWSDYLTKTINTTSKGFAGVVANPRTISPYLNEGSGSNQLVFYGNGQNVSVLTYSVSGLVPGSSVTLSVDVYNLLSPDNLEKALQIMNEGVSDPDDLVTEIKLGRKLSYTDAGTFSAPAPQLSVSTTQPGGIGVGAGNRKTTNKLDWGDSQTLTLTAKADNSGTVTFYFAGANGDFGPLAIDNLRVEGEFEPVIRVVGNPCPQMPAVLRLNSEFPVGTTYSWKEASTGETSSDETMVFFPPTPRDYTVSCTVTMPCGCIATSTHNLSVGECCDDGNGNLMSLTDIYLDDFGRFSGSTYFYRDKNGQEQTVKAREILVGTGNHGYSIDDQLNRGSAFAKELKYSGKNFRNGAYAIATENAYNSPATMFDASGEKGGAFLQIDMKGDGWMDKVVYEQEITDLCPERPISFSAAVGAINKKPTSGFTTNATIQVRLVDSKTNEVIMADGTPIEDTYILDKVGWVEPRKTYDFKLPEGVESVKIQIISKEDDYKAAQRGDIALDDIAFRVCTPPKVEVVASSNNNDLLNLCTGDNLVLEAKIKAKEYFEKPVAGYLFQYTGKDPADPSFDPINDWKDLGNVQLEETYLIDPSNSIAFAGVESKEKVRFRVVIGEYEYLKNQRALWETLDELSPCRNVSFSTIPVEAAWNCDMCEPVDKTSIISADPSTFVSTNTNQEKEVVLCPGSVANLTTEAFAPANPTAMGINVGSNNEPRKYLASWHKGSKNAPGIAGAGSTPGDPVSFYNVTWEDSDWYYLLVKDIEFPNEDGKRCWRWDSIHVIAGNHPAETLEDPAEFCEGMLSTEPTKTISGFKIDWYDGADTMTANHISEPIVGDVTRDLSPKPFWYVLNDKTSGCRGDVKKYVVSVQRVDNPTASTISYIKADVENGALLPTKQSPNAIVGDGISAIIWYKDDETGPIDESDATPTAAEVVGLDGNLTKKYKIKQVNSLGCESEFVPVTIVVSGYPAPTVKDFSVCENSPLLKDYLVATINGVPGGNDASDFELVWYNSKEDGTIDDSQEYDKIDLSPSIQKASATEKTKKYIYYVRQRLKSNSDAESAAVALTVTVYTNPKLAAVETAPKCLGESQNLREMYNVSIDSCEVHYYENGTLTSADVTEAGKYLVTGSYVINVGASDEQTCSSDEEELNVVFHELKANITGDDNTCPNSAVDLDLDLTLGGGLTEDKLIYSWSNNLNNTKANTKNYNTGTAGLNKAGDVMKVSVEVSSAACNGDRAVKQEKEILVGDNRLNGKIKFTEIDNSEPLSDVISSNNLTFNSCGGMVTVELSDVENEKGGSYDLTGTESSTGRFSDETAGSATLNLGVGSYTVSYINGCPTQFSFKIVDNSAKASSRYDELIKCEGDEWWTEIVNLVGPSNTVIEWYHEGAKLYGQTGKKLYFRELKPSDSGVYSYSLLSGGCRFDGDVANGDKLTVKPIAKFDKTSFNDRYEVIYGEPLSLNVGFTTPASSSEIADGVKWTGYSNPNGISLSIPSVERDYNIHVTAENDLYCKADTDVVVLVDAKIQMTANLDRDYMCEGETHQLIVDTKVLGNVLHQSDLRLEATEAVGDEAPRALKLEDKNGKLVADIKPKTNAKYDVIYTYGPGNQKETLPAPLEMKVYGAVDLTLSPASPVCGDGDKWITVEVTPNAYVEELDWSENPVGEVSGDMTGAKITPVYNGSGATKITKQYKVIAKNQHCDAKPFFIPVEVYKPLEGDIMAPSQICEFDRLTLYASSYEADEYEWTYEENQKTFLGSTVSLVPDPEIATFSLHLTRGVCEADVTKTVDVARVPAVARIDSISYKTVEIHLDESNNSGPYKYVIDGKTDDPEVDNNLRSGLSYSTHSLMVVDQYGCQSEKQFVVNPPAIKIPIFISPDGNGENDKFVVEGLAEGYPDAEVTIFDRWGKKLTTYKAGDDTDWDGVYNGHKMPSTDYWYEINIQDIDKIYTGHFTLLR